MKNQGVLIRPSVNAIALSYITVLLHNYENKIALIKNFM